MRCRKCRKENAVKNGKVRGLQRYRCRHCNFNFTQDHAHGWPPSSKLLTVMNYGFGQTMHQVASDCGAASQTVWRWIEEAREGLKGGLKGWLREALLEMVAFALLVEEKPLTPEEIQCELIEHIVWLDTLLLARRLDDEGTQPAINWTALGWNRTDREPTYEEFQSLLREEIASIDAKIRSLMTPQASHETE